MQNNPGPQPGQAEKNRPPKSPARAGPRPLPLHLTIAMLQWQSWQSALQLLNSRSADLQAPPLLPGWSALSQQLQALQTRDKNAAARLETALTGKANQTYAAFLDGVERYRASSYTRTAPEAPVIWQQGTTRLLDYSAGGAGAPVLVIPSLINRYHVMDIDPACSFVRAMAQRGFRPFLIDWGAPGQLEKLFTLDDYFRHRLLPVLQMLHEKNGQRVHLAGYCMGGLLATALAQIMDHAVDKLLCLATPWDFHADDPGLPVRVAAMLAAVDPVLDTWGEMPVDVLQGFFISLQPFVPHDKFVRFAAMPPETEAARLFVLVEDWINDGVPLPKEVARTCLRDWYVANAPAQNNWKVLGEIIAPHQLAAPSMHVIPARDKIVPPASALALARSMKKAELIQPSFGHISMMVNAAAHKKLWLRLFDWLAS